MNRLIAIVGMAGSGKSVATGYLEEIGYNKIYFGGLIYKLMKEEKIQITPESQKIYREKIRKEHGMGAVAKLLLNDIEESFSKQNTVLDGLYSWDEYTILKDKFKDNLQVIGIVCDKDIRYERISKREDRPFNNEEIIERDLTEIENIKKGGPIAYADYYILNNGTYEEMINRLKEIINKE